MPSHRRSQPANARTLTAALIALCDADGRRAGEAELLRRLPIIAVEDALRVFETLPRSPYMTFAPPLRPEAKEALPAIAHFDGTARPQVVAAADEPWLHALLMAVRNRTALLPLLQRRPATRTRRREP